MTVTDVQYYERMATSLNDKLRMLDFLPPVTEDYAPHVLDVGAGGGELTGALLDLGYRVTAVDPDRESFRHLHRTYRDATVDFLYAHEVGEYSERFDAVLASSVMHEVYSYRDPLGVYGFQAIDQTLGAFHHVLNPGGVLVIRDGVKPDDAEKKGYVVIRRERDDLPVNEFPVYEYLRQCPFDEIRLRRNRPGFYHGNYQSLMEFVFTFNWGIENYHREAKELYGIMKLNEYVDRVESFGFKNFHAESYVQQGYVDALAPKIKLLDAKYKPLPMLDTNALWAFRKE